MPFCRCTRLTFWMIQAFVIWVSIAQTASAEDKAKVESRALEHEPLEKKLSYPGESLRNGIRNLIRHHEEAITANPESLEHHVGLVDAYVMLWCFGFVPRDEVLAKISSTADAAFALDDQDATAHYALGIANLCAWNWAEADKHLLAATQIAPDLAPAQHWYALYLASGGQHHEAMKLSRKAVSLDPSPGMQTGSAAVLYFGRKWQAMIRQMESTIKKSPDFAPAYDWLGMAYVQNKQFDKSIATYEKAVELSGGLAEIVAGLGHAYALGGEESKAREVLAHLQRMDEQWYVPPVQIAYVLVGLGEYDEAFRYLDRASREHSWELVFLRTEPWFDPIRNDPRFERIEATVNFLD